MKIRTAIKEDFVKLNEIYEQVDMLHRNIHPDRFKKPDVIGRSDDYYNELINNDYTKLLVAVDKDVVGFAEAYVMSAPLHPLLVDRKWIVIDCIAVAKEYQRKGVGQLLLNRIYEWAENIEIDEIELNVYSFNETAITFYKNNDFSEVSKKMSKKLK